MSSNKIEDEQQAATIAKMNAEISKFIAETAKINSQNKWYPLIIGSTATLAIVKLFL